MPLYTISTAAALPPATREAIAQMVTDVHCRHTGAPPSFVTVIFWTNVPLPIGQDLNVFGSVRAGRSHETKAGLQREMIARMSDLAGVDPERIGYSAFEIPAHKIMEGGVVLPEPGDEAAWLAAHH